MKHIKLFEDYNELMLEYIQNEMIYLRNYFKMSDDEKADELAWTFSYQLTPFLNDYEYNDKIPSDVNDDEIIDYLYNKEPNIFKQFGKWLFRKLEQGSLRVYDGDIPSWYYFGTPSLVKNQWLIHFTDDADSIARNGFTIGMDDMRSLGLTTYFKKSYKTGGYNFAYSLDDFKRYAFDRGETRYGSEAVIFRASGLKMWHNSDEEPQVIFYGNTAKNIIAITSGEDSDWAVFHSKSGEVLYENDDLEKVVEWIIKNYSQYRKHL